MILISKSNTAELWQDEKTKQIVLKLPSKKEGSKSMLLPAKMQKQLDDVIQKVLNISEEVKALRPIRNPLFPNSTKSSFQDFVDNHTINGREH